MSAIERSMMSPTVLMVLIFLLALLPIVSMTEGVGTRDTITSIIGKVTDDIGSPIIGAVIRVVASDRSYYNYTFTNSTGEYWVNTTYVGDAYMEVEKDGFLKMRRSGITLSGGTELTIDIALTDMPAETATLSGHLTLIGDGPVVGARIRFHTETGIGPVTVNYYDYEEISDSAGYFEVDLFGSLYDYEVTYKGQRVTDGNIQISGSGPNTLDIEIPDIPESRTIIQGFVTNGSGPVQGAMVLVGSQDINVQNVSFTDGSGHYEIMFFGGDQMFLVMAGNNDMYFTRVKVPSEGMVWYNVSLKERSYTLSGTVHDPEGDPMENATISYVQPHVFPDQNTFVTEADGRFDLLISNTPGFLVVSGEDPFEGWEYDTYFRDMGSIGGHMEFDVQLTDQDISPSISDITFIGWERFDFIGSMMMPLNNTRYMRLFLDSFAGDGDLVLSEEEFSFFYDQMISQDPEMQDAPMGLNTTGNFTMDGLVYDRMEGSHLLDFRGILGPVMGTERLEVIIKANYTLNGTLPDVDVHHLELNLSLDKERDSSKGTVNLPTGWRLTDVSDTVHSIVQDGDGLTIINGKDPDPDDRIDNEIARMTVYDDTFTGSIEVPEELYEGEDIWFGLNLTDHLPEQAYNITWDFGDQSSTFTNGSNTYHNYGDNGTYELRVIVNDLYNRTLELTTDVTVLNKAPKVVIVVSGAPNMTAYEGDEVNITVNAVDVADDALTIFWPWNGSFSNGAPYNDETRTMLYYPMDDGNMTIKVKVDDEDGGSTISNVTIRILNRPPVLEVTVKKGSPALKEGDNVILLITKKNDDSPEDELTVKVDVSGPDHDIEEEEDDQVYNIMFDEAGTYNVTVTLSDDDGGTDVKFFEFTVAVNRTWDHDGDGLPMDWEELYGLSDSDPTDASKDKDDDGLSNLEEYLKGSDPTDGNDPPKEKGEKDNWVVLLILAVLAVLIILIVIFVILMKRKNEKLVEE